MTKRWIVPLIIFITFLILILLLRGDAISMFATIPTPPPLLTMVPTSTNVPTNTLTPSNTVLPSQTFTQISSPNSVATSIPQERPEYDHISGTYNLERSDGGGCIVKVILERSEKPFDEIRFELLCVRGAPSYNSGYARGKIMTAGNLAVLSPNPDCNIVFDFQDGSLKVTQIGMDFDCGFGHAVYANGIYTLINNELPVLGCMERTNPCNLPLPQNFSNWMEPFSN